MQEEAQDKNQVQRPKVERALGVVSPLKTRLSQTVPKRVKAQQHKEEPLYREQGAQGVSLLRIARALMHLLQLRKDKTLHLILLIVVAALSEGYNLSLWLLMSVSKNLDFRSYSILYIKVQAISNFLIYMQAIQGWDIMPSQLSDINLILIFNHCTNNLSNKFLLCILVISKSPRVE